MTSLTVNGRTYTDDRDPTTGLGNGGHRTRLLPMFGDAMVEIAAQTGNVLGLGSRFLFDLGTAAADPGPGLLRLNNAAPASATALYVDNQNSAATDVSGWLATFVTNRGQLWLRNASASKWHVFQITAAAANSGYYTLTVTYGAGLGGNFSTNEAVILSFAPAGPPGSGSAANDGSVTTPSINFASQTGLGLYRKSASVIALAAGGADLLELRPATLAEAQAGTNTLATMTPQRVAEAIAARLVGNAGGLTGTGDLTLTASSASAIAVTPSAPGFFLTLPNATTMNQAAAGVFSIYNFGDFDYGIRDNAGTRLGWIPPRGSCVIDLVDKTTAAGLWNPVGAEKIGVTASFVSLSSPATINSQVNQAIDIGSSRTLFLISGAGVFGVVYDGANRSWGSLTLIRSTNSQCIGLSPGSGQALVATIGGGGGTNLQAVVLSISGTTITVNTAATATLGGGVNTVSFPDGAYMFGGAQFVAVGSTYVLGYGRDSTTTAVIPMTISGTTVTIGAETVLDSGSLSPPRLYASGSVLRVVRGTNSSVVCTPYSVSGTNLTIGTAATVTSTDVRSPRALRSFVNSNGNIVALYRNSATSATLATIFRLTGTTEAASTVTINSFGSSAALVASVDYLDLGGGKVLTVSGWASSVNILTDSTGTASAGTELFFSSVASPIPLALTGSGATARVALQGIDLNTNETVITQVTLNTSGASPTLASAQSAASLGVTVTPTSDHVGRRSPLLLRASSAAYGLQPNPPSSTNPSLIDGVLYLAGGVYLTPKPRTGARAPLAITANDFESWFGGVPQRDTGYQITKLECAA